MPEKFDPYHKWLGISPKDQPPNHYRLLGVEPFESDDDVISSASDMRMSHVRNFQSGNRSALAQKILNEISSARICLLDPQKKAQYNEQLRQGPKEKSSPPPRKKKTTTETIRPPLRHKTDATADDKRRKHIILISSVAGVFFLCLFGWYLAAGPSSNPEVEPESASSSDGDKRNGEKRKGDKSKSDKFSSSDGENNSLDNETVSPIEESPGGSTLDSGSVDETIKLWGFSKTGAADPASGPDTSRPASDGQIAGRWVVHFPQTAIYPAMGRTYVIDAQGNAALVEKVHRGRARKLNIRSKLISKDGNLLLPWGSGKLDRLIFHGGGRLSVQLFESWEDYPNKPAVTGTGTRK